MLYSCDEECCDRCRRIFPARQVADTSEGLLCRDCRKALAVDDEDVEVTDQDDG